MTDLNSFVLTKIRMLTYCLTDLNPLYLFLPFTEACFVWPWPIDQACKLPAWLGMQCIASIVLTRPDPSFPPKTIFSQLRRTDLPFINGPVLTNFIPSPGLWMNSSAWHWPAGLHMRPQPVRQHLALWGQSESVAQKSPQRSLPSATGHRPAFSSAEIRQNVNTLCRMQFQSYSWLSEERLVVCSHLQKLLCN